MHEKSLYFAIFASAPAGGPALRLGRGLAVRACGSGAPAAAVAKIEIRGWGVWTDVRFELDLTSVSEIRNRFHVCFEFVLSVSNSIRPS